MAGGPTGRRRLLGAVALGVLALATLLAGNAWAARVHPVRPSLRLNGGKSPFKLAHSAARGIVPRSHARTRSLWSAPHPSSFAGGECEVACGARPLEYHKGEVMHKVKLYLIDWEPSEPSNNGQAGTSFTPLPSGYMATIETFLQRLAAESGGSNNVYSVDKLYGDSTPGEYQVEFGQTLRDEEKYPERIASTCPTPTATEKYYPPSGQPCISDGASPTGVEHFQLSEALYKFLQAHTSLPRGMKAIYFMLTPHYVNSCSGFEGGVAACNTNYYCAYHSAFDIKSGGVTTPVVYANMPYDHVEGCETPAEPNGTPADDEINTLSHEDNEAVTDPLGEGWYDYEGYEVGDKCTYPFFNPAEDESPATDAYGPLLGGSSGASAYNQEIGVGHYLLQREWSNAAGGCVTRAPRAQARFSYEPSPPVANVQVHFSGLASSTEAGEIVSYEWNFGDSTSPASGAEPTHTYTAEGSYPVTLTVRNNSGATSTVEREVLVESESSARVVTNTTTQTFTTTEATPTVLTTTQTLTATETTSSPLTITQQLQTTATKTVNLFTTSTLTTSALEAPVAHYSSAGLARLLGLPPNGKRISGLGRLTLGHAQCPPACAVNAKIIATVRAGAKHKHSFRHITIGRLKETIASRQARSMALRLTHRGRRLLHHAHRLHVKLIVNVEDRSGGGWRVLRRLTLTVGARAARAHHRGRAARRRRHRARAARRRREHHRQRHRHRRR